MAAALLLVGIEVAALATRGNPQAPARAVASTGTSTTTALTTSSVVGSPATTTTLVVSPPTTTVVNGAGTITYILNAAATVTVSAKSDSWIEVRTTAGGTVLHTGTLLAGQTRSYPTPIWIRTGKPAALTVTADGARLSVPDDRGPIDVIVTIPADR
ncbi:DUF4115 domain-containing protein [Acidiferrimicrobium sp. IK]|uniref:DUF4115 domain-containing protein n=1 Tax=Acidiferrimicrobium sp. IK TaxID=2871700 RepID=UPI0021CB9565|nr:DUF4115 domain-containing protein [Acidiferrimicrobium sp. IK]MCU4187262.1 DUF4115 domain-containing protein [Acidiferrimicrobium sp. IK]